MHTHLLSLDEWPQDLLSMVQASGMELFTALSHKLVDDPAVTDVSPTAAANLNLTDE
ncbi:hypothetical protein H0H87_005036, partial [Tephrocybe sp. NHM501043]